MPRAIRVPAATVATFVYFTWESFLERVFAGPRISYVHECGLIACNSAVAIRNEDRDPGDTNKAELPGVSLRRRNRMLGPSFVG
ncbi:hypothetical protein SCA03_30660 [Streptomyces cacaoi]|uniref:Uncharacterized protein n=1 Tax=Streptomyces cacaoi TaxID=1898 RepID=A0A4Y3QYL7_STRCI|nr:hypothetical protein SCA03_30660 [Streptomyces cacaoi]